jgi:Stage II sporulation protein
VKPVLNKIFSIAFIIGLSFGYSPFIFAQEVPIEEPVVVPTVPTPDPAPSDPAPTPEPVVTPDPVPVVVEETPTDPAPTEVEETPAEPEVPPVEDEDPAPTETEASIALEKEQYIKYTLFERYQKKEIYKKYLRYRQIAYLYPWEAGSKTEKKTIKALKKDHDKYRKYLKNTNKNTKYASLKDRSDHYQNYGALKAEYFSLKPFANYAHYIQYDKSTYDAYKDYGGAEYKAGYDAYAKRIADKTVEIPSEVEIVDASSLGPNIAVGICQYSPSTLRSATIKVRSNFGFEVRSKNNNFVATMPANVKLRVDYIGSKDFRLTRSDTDAEVAIKGQEVRFVPVKGHEYDTVFNLDFPGTDVGNGCNGPNKYGFDEYRDGIRVRYFDSPDADADRIWVINDLPLEHYVWGMGEIGGTGPSEYNRVMTTIYRTYGFWKILYSTKYAPMGFKVDATSGSQIYYGYDWEVGHDRIKIAAEATRGRIVTYDNDPALTPYSSWTDGKTRRYEDGHWGHVCDKDSSKISKVYPWLSEADDSWGKHPTLSRCDLANGGNHMVGLSANGALNQARQGRVFDQILTHYYRGVSVNPRY